MPVPDNKNFLQLKSLSLSLDSLLDYSDKDVEEETFEVFYYFITHAFYPPLFKLFAFVVVKYMEFLQSCKLAWICSMSHIYLLTMVFSCPQLSLFAESFYEMLQYQMGCRVLTFLQVRMLSLY